MKLMKQKALPWLACIFVAFMSLVGCNNDSDNSDSNIAGMEITPYNPVLTFGEVFQLNADTLSFDKAKTPIKSDITWKSNDDKIATVDESGKLTAIESGKVLVTAIHREWQASVLVTIKPKGVTLNAIKLSPDNPTLYLAQRQPFTALGIYSDGSTENLTGRVKWESSKTDDISIDEKSGIAQVKTKNGGDITAKIFVETSTKTFPDVTGKATVTVNSATLDSISINPDKATLYLQQTKSLIAEGKYSDNGIADITDQVTWSSMDENHVKIIQPGVIQGVAEGDEAIKVVYTPEGKQEKEALADITVESASLERITITPEAGSMMLYESKPFQAIGIDSNDKEHLLDVDVMWVSENPEIVYINPESGLAEAMKAGETTITVTDMTTKMRSSTKISVSDQKLTSLVVTPEEFTIYEGLSRQLTATGTYADGTEINLTQSAVWHVDLTGVTTGKVQLGPEKGMVTGEASTQKAKIKVIATIDGDTATSEVEVSSTKPHDIKISPEKATVSIGATVSYTAVAEYKQGSYPSEFFPIIKGAEWSVDKPELATINKETGELTAVDKIPDKQPVTVTVTFNTVTSKTAAEITILDAALDKLQILSNSDDLSFVIGGKRQLSAIGVFTDGLSMDMTTQNGVEWSTDKPDILEVIPSGENAGQVTAKSKGEAVITVSKGEVKGTMTYQVVDAADAKLEEITITPAVPEVPNGTSVNFTATGKYSDDKERDITESVEWVSSDLTVATITQKGVAETLTQGKTTTITAKLDGEETNTTLKVTAATVTSVEIKSPGDPKPNTITLKQAQHKYLTATATFSDGQKLDVTRSGEWISDNWLIASIIGSGTTGDTISAGRVLAGLLKGTTTIHFKYKGQDHPANLTVE